MVVARCQCEHLPGIGIRHDDDSADARLQVLGGDTLKMKLLLVGLEQRGDGLHLVLRAKVARQVCGIITRT